MIQYEQPQVQLLEFLSRERLASENMTEPALVDDNVSIGEVPTFSEGIEDW